MLTALLACAPASPVPSPGTSDTGAAPVRETDPLDTAPGDTADPTPDSAEDTATADTADDGPLGTPLDPPWAPPSFAVLNQHGEARDAAWLTGHPTVLWFFREATGST